MIFLSVQEIHDFHLTKIKHMHPGIFVNQVGTEIILDPEIRNNPNRDGIHYGILSTNSLFHVEHGFPSSFLECHLKSPFVPLNQLVEEILD